MTRGDTPSTVADKEIAVHEVVQRIMHAWADNDADAFAEIFTEDATLVGDAYMGDREEIRSFMAAGFAGPYQGTRVIVEPIRIRFVRDDVAVVTTEGNVLVPGSAEASPELGFLATCIVISTDDGWRISAYQNSKGTA